MYTCEPLTLKSFCDDFFLQMFDSRKRETHRYANEQYVRRL